jgi:hypothetical protein
MRRGIGLGDCLATQMAADDARAFAARFFRYSQFSAAAWHCLKAVVAVGLETAKAGGRAAVEQIKALPVSNPLYGGPVRAEGKFIHASRLW